MYGAFDVVLYFVNLTVLVANKLTSYLILERPQHIMNLQEHERQVWTIKDGLGAVCLFYFEQIVSIVSVCC